MLKALRYAGLALLVALLLPCGPAHAQKPRAERPTYAVGDKWIRNDGLYDLVRIENDMYVFAAGPGREVHMTRDGVVAYTRRGERVVEFDPPPKLGWPLEVGKSGWSTGRYRGPNWQGTVGAPGTFTWKVEAVEPVTVAGTTLEAFRVAFGVTNRTRDGGAVSRSWSGWYSPEVRQWVKVESEDLGFLRFAVVAFDRPAAPQPLVIALESPRDDGRASTPEIIVAGKVTSGKGVGQVAVLINGQQIATPDERRAPRAEVVLSVPLRLRPGKNVVLVRATDTAGETREEARTLFFDAPPLALGPQPSPGDGPRPAPRLIPDPGERARREEARPPAAPAEPQKPAPVSVAALAPLQVTLSSPADKTKVEHESVAVAGVVSGGKGVARVVVSLNGVEVSRFEEKTPQRALAVNMPVKLREGLNTLVVTATDADGMLHQEVRSVQYEKVVPLSIAFRYPEDRARVTEDASVIAAMVISSKGVAKVSVTLNGGEVSQLAERAPQKSVVVTVPVTLRPGANAIAISATEPDGTVRQEIRTVVYDPPKVAAIATVSAAPAPVVRNQWAVVIGVGQYENKGVPSLSYTVSDAEAVFRSLTGPAGFKKEHVLLLTDKSERKPTLRNIKWALGTFLGRSAQKDDTVLIFFAGHGAPEVDTRGIERDGLAKYLIPSDADPDDLYSTALPMDELQTIFGRIEAERVVAFLDACYSGAAGGRTFAAKRTRAGAVDDLFLERLTRSKGRAIITASRPSEVSIELPELGHGIFTYYLTEGLKGAADLNRDGIVTLQELYEYLEQHVSQKARSVGGNQHPVMKGELEGVLPLSKVR